MERSVRRRYLDYCLSELVPKNLGAVLDLGGKRNLKRGKFDVSDCNTESIVFFNPDPETSPDICGMAPPIPCQNESFDTVICTEVIEYINDPAELIREISRVLKPNGIVILSVPFLVSEHQDLESDFVRITGPGVTNLISDKFDIVSIYYLGGTIAVIFDLVRSRILNSDTSFFGTKFLRKLVIVLEYVAFASDRKLVDFNDRRIHTGTLVIARKTMT